MPTSRSQTGPNDRFAQVRFWLPCAMLFLGVAAVHLLFVSAPPAWLDEGDFLSWARFRAAQFTALMPPAQHHLGYTYACLALWPFFDRVIQITSNLAGIEVAVLRFPFVLAGLSSLLMLAAVSRRLNFARTSTLAAVATLGLSDHFWLVSHMVRPEAFVLFMTWAANLLLLTWTHPLAAFAAGSILGSAVGFHQAAYLGFVSALIIGFYRGRDLRSRGRWFVWFSLGAVGGIVMATRLIDADAGTQYILIGKGTLIWPSVFARYGFNPLGIVNGLLRFWFYEGSPMNGFSSALVAAALTGVALHVRRFKALSEEGKLLTILTPAMYAALIPAPTDIKYLIYLFPWLILSLVHSLEMLFRRRWVLDPIDAVITGTVTSFVLSVLDGANAMLWWTPLWLLLLVQCLGYRKAGWVGLITGVGIFLNSPDVLWFEAARLSHWAHFQISLLFCWLAYPVALLALFKKFSAPQRAAWSGALVVLVLVSTFGQASLARISRYVRLSRLTPEVAAAINDLARKRRVVCVPTLALYAPTIGHIDVDPLLKPRMRKHADLSLRKPDRVLIPARYRYMVCEPERMGRDAHCLSGKGAVPLGPPLDLLRLPGLEAAPDAI